MIKKKKKKVRRKWNVISNLNCCTILVSEDRKGWSISQFNKVVVFGSISWGFWFIWSSAINICPICPILFFCFWPKWEHCVEWFAVTDIFWIYHAQLWCFISFTVFSSKCWICIIYFFFGFSFTHKKIFKISILQSQIMNLL